MWKLLTYKHTTNGDIRRIASLNDRCAAVDEHIPNYLAAISAYFYYNGYKLESTIECNEQTHPEYFI